MDRSVLERKRQILNLIDSVKGVSATVPFRHEMMTYLYVLTNGAIEYMVETILREWVARKVKQHSNSGGYRGRSGVSEYLRISVEISNNAIAQFNNPTYSRIVDLIRETAGDVSAKRFKRLVAASKATEPELDAKLLRINQFRQRLAHGQIMPMSAQPNLDELRVDFECVYNHIIMNLDGALKGGVVNIAVL